MEYSPDWRRRLFARCFAAILALAFFLPNSASAQKRHPKPPTSSYAEAESSPSFAGMITDSFCGARHDKNLNRGSAECARFCVRKGAKYSLVTVDKTYELQGNTSSVEQLAGQRAKITGQLNGDVIVVASVKSEE